MAGSEWSFEMIPYLWTRWVLCPSESWQMGSNICSVLGAPDCHAKCLEEYASLNMSSVPFLHCLHTINTTISRSAL